MLEQKSVIFEYGYPPHGHRSQSWRKTAPMKIAAVLASAIATILRPGNMMLAAMYAMPATRAQPVMSSSMLGKHT